MNIMIIRGIMLIGTRILTIAFARTSNSVVVTIAVARSSDGVAVIFIRFIISIVAAS